MGSLIPAHPEKTEWLRRRVFSNLTVDHVEPPAGNQEKSTADTADSRKEGDVLGLMRHQPSHRKRIPGSVLATLMAVALCGALAGTLLSGRALAQQDNTALLAAQPTLAPLETASPLPTSQPRATPLPDSTEALQPTQTPFLTTQSQITKETWAIGDGLPKAAAAALNAIAEDDTLDMQGKFDAVFKRYHTLGACVCVIENGRVTHMFCYGQVDRDGTPVTPDTLFRVGSISKMVTSMGVMRLVEDGALTLDGDVSSALGLTVRNPQYPDTPITLRQLMSHTAGFRDSGIYSSALKGKVTPLSELFGTKKEKFLFVSKIEPGTAWQYSNFGGGLLGSLIESVSGQTLDQYLSDTLFAPLGITAAYQSALLPEDAQVSDIFHMPAKRIGAKVRDGQAAYTRPDGETHYTLSAGKLTISAPDLAKLMIALCDGGLCDGVRVLSEESATAMQTLQNNLGSVTCQSDWGLGMCSLSEEIVPGHVLYGHGGKASGMLCAAFVDPAQHTGVVMLTNGCNDDAEYEGLGMLSVAVLRLSYAFCVDDSRGVENSWLVE